MLEALLAATFSLVFGLVDFSVRVAVVTAAVMLIIGRLRKRGTVMSSHGLV